MQELKQLAKDTLIPVLAVLVASFLLGVGTAALSSFGMLTRVQAQTATLWFVMIAGGLCPLIIVWNVLRPLFGSTRHDR